MLSPAVWFIIYSTITIFIILPIIVWIGKRLGINGTVVDASYIFFLLLMWGGFLIAIPHETNRCLVPVGEYEIAQNNRYGVVLWRSYTALTENQHEYQNIGRQNLVAPYIESSKNIYGFSIVEKEMELASNEEMGKIRNVEMCK